MYEQFSAIVKYRRSAKTGGCATSLIRRRVTLKERQVRKGRTSKSTQVTKKEKMLDT